MLRGEKSVTEAMAELFVELFAALQRFEMDVLWMCASPAEAACRGNILDLCRGQGGGREVREDINFKVQFCRWWPPYF